jgi:hypothetical protein
VSYANKTGGVSKNNKEFIRSKRVISTNLKAEIARQLYGEDGYYRVINTIDREVIKAHEEVQKIR